MAYNLPKFRGHFTFEDGYLLCPHCGGKMRCENDCVTTTLVAFHCEDGHNHDDNCLTRAYRCEFGHTVTVGIRRRCNAKDCEWKGKQRCDCHDGDKVNTWPNKF